MSDSSKQGSIHLFTGKDLFHSIDEPVLRFWKEHQIFKKSVDSRPREDSYVFYDGPPFVTGIPHFGHLFVSTLKDVIPRYQTMLGKRVERVWGWDCHGLPIEEKVERKLGTKNRREIEEKIGLERFINECKTYVNEISDQWGWYIDHIGRWVDMQNPYRTDTIKYMESVIWGLKQAYDKGLIYHGKRISLYCPRCGTPLSKFEIQMDNSYKELEDPSVFVMFRVPELGNNTYLLIWTTTPWTLPMNAAVAVKPDEYYVLLETKGGKRYVLAKARVEHIFKNTSYNVVEEFKGSKLVGLPYEPLFDYFKDQAIDKDFKVYPADFVSMDEGTGLVHIAPAYGEEDFNLAKEQGISVFEAINEQGKFTEPVSDFKGLYFKDADKLIIERLQETENLFKVDTIVHSYPVCYRCKTPLLYKAQESWFIRLEGNVKERMLEHAKKINWVPEHSAKAFENVIKTAPDWGISRTRYWATPLPFWKCNKCGFMEVLGSIKEIEERSGKKVTDLHRPYIDEHTYECPKCKQGTMRRIPDVVDVWFESGSMPYAQFHYPFENRNEFKHKFPADFIVEYVAQIKGWFNVLHRVSTILFDSNAFKNVIAHGVILGTDGRKMSKSLGNYPDPRDTIEKYGADALRLYFTSYSFVESGSEPFKEELVREQIKEVILPLLNIYNFFVLNYKPEVALNISNARFTPKHVLDRWVLYQVNEFVGNIRESLDNYRIPMASRHIRNIVKDVSVWYIKRSRERFRSGDSEAIQTLWLVLLTVVKASAPFIPFVTETIYQQLRNYSKKLYESVHLDYYPELVRYDPEDVKEILHNMDVVRSLAGIMHSIRVQHGIPVRQVLYTAYVDEQYDFPEEYMTLLQDEINVKEVRKVDLDTLMETETIKLGEDYGLKAALDITIDEELLKERVVRDVIRNIQMARKRAGLKIGQKVNISLQADDQLYKIIKESQDHIREQVDAAKLEVNSLLESKEKQEYIKVAGKYKLMIIIKD